MRMRTKQNEWKTFVIIGPKKRGDLGRAIIENRSLQKELRRMAKLGEPHEVKLKFKAPSAIAKVVADVYDGWIENRDDYVQDLAQYFGYSVSKLSMPRRTKRRMMTYVIVGDIGEKLRRPAARSRLD